MQDYKQVVQAMANRCGDSILKAFQLADRVHKGQKRKSGEPYISHPVIVASIVFDIGADCDTVCAALLHDTLEEDTKNSDNLENTILSEFGDHVLYMVKALSKDASITDKLEQQSQYMERIQQAFGVDIDIFFLKVADLLHNMSTIVALSPQRKEQWIKELKYEYIPLFGEYFHQVPLTYKDAYQNMVQKVQNVIDSYETSLV